MKNIKLSSIDLLWEMRRKTSTETSSNSMHKAQTKKLHSISKSCRKSWSPGWIQNMLIYKVCLTSSVVQLTPGDTIHLKSENFPRNYLRGRSCWMFITTASSHFIKLTFSFFNLDTTHDDFLKVKFNWFDWNENATDETVWEKITAMFWSMTFEIVNLKTFQLNSFCSTKSSRDFILTSYFFCRNKWLLSHLFKYIMGFCDASPTNAGIKSEV